MTHEPATIFDAALALPPKERAELAVKLLESLADKEEQIAIDEVWEEEALARLKAYDEGKMEGVPYEEVVRKLRQGSSS